MALQKQGHTFLTEHKIIPKNPFTDTEFRGKIKGTFFSGVLHYETRFFREEQIHLSDYRILYSLFRNANANADTRF